MRKFLLAFAVMVLAAFGWATLAGAGPDELPQNWHVHDCNLTGGPACGFDADGDWHLPASFFPTILGESAGAYLADPAMCPNATDKAFLPNGRQDGQPLRAGVCMTSTEVIHLRTVPAGTEGPAGWGLRTGPESGFVTYYLVTPR